MGSPHTRHRIVEGGEVFVRGGAAVGKIAFDAAMVRDMVAFEEMAFEATWEVVRIQVVSSRLLQVQKIRENDRK